MAWRRMSRTNSRVGWVTYMLECRAGHALLDEREQVVQCLLTRCHVESEHRLHITPDDDPSRL